MQSTIPVRSLPDDVKQAVEENGGQVISYTHGWFVRLEHTDIALSESEVCFILGDGTRLSMRQFPEANGHRNELQICPPKSTTDQPDQQR